MPGPVVSGECAICVHRKTRKNVKRKRVKRAYTYGRHKRDTLLSRGSLRCPIPFTMFMGITSPETSWMSLCGGMSLTVANKGGSVRVHDPPQFLPVIDLKGEKKKRKKNVQKSTWYNVVAAIIRSPHGRTNLCRAKNGNTCSVGETCVCGVKLVRARARV